MNYKTVPHEKNTNNFSIAQKKCRQQFEQSKLMTIFWDDIFNKIRDLFNLDEYNDEIETELIRDVRFLYFALKKRESPPDSSIQLFVSSGLFVDMFKSLKTTKYRNYILGIVCFILKKEPSTISIFNKQNFSESLNTFISHTENMTEDMKIYVPYYVSLYLKCVSKLNENLYYFFFSPQKNGINYFQLSCRLIQTCLFQEENQVYKYMKFPEAHQYIQKTESNIYSSFSYLIKWIVPNPPNSESPEIKLIFSFISKAFQLNLAEIYHKLIACLNRIWNYQKVYLMHYFASSLIYAPICQIINNQISIKAQQGAMVLMYELLKMNITEVSLEINAEKVFNTAQKMYGEMIGNNIYDKTTVNSIFLLGQKFLVDKSITINVDQNMNSLLGIIASLFDMQYEAKDAAAFLVFVIIRLSNLTFFQDAQYKMDIINKAFDVALSGSVFILDNAISTAFIILQMISAKNDIALSLAAPLEKFITDIYETNDNEEFSERIEVLYNDYMQNQ